MLQADSITNSAFNFKFLISDDFNTPSFKAEPFCGGVVIKPGSFILVISLATTPWVANERTLYFSRSIDLIFFSLKFSFKKYLFYQKNLKFHLTHLMF